MTGSPQSNTEATEGESRKLVSRAGILRQQKGEVFIVLYALVLAHVLLSIVLFFHLQYYFPFQEKYGKLSLKQGSALSLLQEDLPSPCPPTPGTSSVNLGGCAESITIIYLLTCASLLDVEFNCPYKNEPIPVLGLESLIVK